MYVRPVSVMTVSYTHLDVYKRQVYPLGTDEIATKLSSVRALNAAKEKGQELVTICSACHHVIKRVNDDMKNVEDIRFKANNLSLIHI